MSSRTHTRNGNDQVNVSRCHGGGTRIFFAAKYELHYRWMTVDRLSAQAGQAWLPGLANTLKILQISRARTFFCARPPLARGLHLAGSGVEL